MLKCSINNEYITRSTYLNILIKMHINVILAFNINSYYLLSWFKKTNIISYARTLSCTYATLMYRLTSALRQPGTHTAQF